MQPKMCVYLLLPMHVLRQLVLMQGLCRRRLVHGLPHVVVVVLLLLLSLLQSPHDYLSSAPLEGAG